MEKNKDLKELLGDHIPVDEAKVLSNGRITCLICLHRPIFDTLGVLVSHRKGKKHSSELEKYLKRKAELTFAELKKKHKISLANNSKKTSSLGNSKSDIKITKFKRKPMLEVPSIQDTALGNCKNSRKSELLKNYFKKIHRKPSFKESLPEIKSTYSTSTNKEPALSSSSSLPVNHLNSYQSSNANSTYEMELKMSGWIKTSSGKWVKDPEAEFDSDEADCPPSPPTVT